MPAEAGSNTRSEEREAPGTIVSGLVKSFGVPPTTVAVAIVTYSLAVASFVMLGIKLK